ncbi:MAG: glycerol kinase GlpK [Firmicutes bacterium]|nr:glycerol kinase GlpK [Bacillota bacterium]
MKKYVIALDQGTTSSRAIIFDKNRNIVEMKQREFPQIFPKPGWVEHDPMDIYSTQMAVLHEAVAAAGIPAEEIAAIGITNQRETTIVWDKKTGEPVYNAIVWQCSRTSAECEEYIRQGHGQTVREKTGLLIDSYFSATKIRWILEHVEGARQRAEAGELLFGTVDTWLVWKMTGGKVHVTDMTNASRTMLFNIRERCWDKELLDIFGIPESMLPKVCSSSEVYGYYDLPGEGPVVPIAGIAGDQQAALFGQACFEAGQAKNTYGTGCFMLMNIGEECRISDGKLVTTIGISLPDRVQYAVEGSVFVGGAVIQWLRDGLEILEKSSDSEKAAESVSDNGGVYFVPAFTGLGAPYWDMYARGAILGITRGTTREHIIRAAVESMAFQSMELLESLEKESGIAIDRLRVDGGACSNDFLMQFQSDICGVTIERPVIRETTALGAAYLAGLAAGFWESLEDVSRGREVERSFEPAMDAEERSRLSGEWRKAVGRTLDWAR